MSPRTPSPVFLTCVVIDAAPLTASRTYPTRWDHRHQTASRLRGMVQHFVQKCYPYTYGGVRGETRRVRARMAGMGTAPMSDLNTSIPTGSSWILRTASAILVTRGRSRHGALNGRTRAFLLAPVKKAPSAPTSIVLR